MKTRHKICITMLIISILLFSCAPLDEANQTISDYCTKVPEVFPVSEVQEEAKCEELVELSEFDQINESEEYTAQWYIDRNYNLANTIRRNNPSLTEEQIQSTVKKMSIDPNKPMVALSFDDGPIPGITDQILDVLVEYNARATFFVCGWRLEDEEHKNILRRIAASGCEIGNHTWSHELNKEQNYIGMRYEIENTNKIIFDTSGLRPRCFRPPGGRNSYEAIRVTRENNMIIVLWSQSGNAFETDPAKIAQNVEKQIVDGKELCDGDVILLHDTHYCMVDAVKIMIPQLLKQGYQLVTVWELLNCTGAEITPGAIYQD